MKKGTKVALILGGLAGVTALMLSPKKARAESSDEGAEEDAEEVVIEEVLQADEELADAAESIDGPVVEMEDGTIVPAPDPDTPDLDTDDPDEDEAAAEALESEAEKPVDISIDDAADELIDEAIEDDGDDGYNQSVVEEVLAVDEESPEETSDQLYTGPETPVDSNYAQMLASMLIQAEERDGWKAAHADSVGEYQADNGLKMDKKYGPGTGLHLALATGRAPIVRYWPAGSWKGSKVYNDYITALEEAGIEHREAGQGFGTKKGPAV